MRTRKREFEAALSINAPMMHCLPLPSILPPNIGKNTLLQLHRLSPSLPTAEHATEMVQPGMVDPMEHKNAVAGSDVADAGVASLGGSSPPPDPTLEKSVVEASDVAATAGAVPPSFEGSRASLRHLIAVRVHRVLLL